MSVYTEFKTKEIVLRKDIPGDIVEFLDNWINKGIPNWEADFNHQFFKEERWHRMFGKRLFDEDPSTSPYFRNENGYWKLFLWTDINYGIDEIIQFVDWIKPFMAGHKPVEYIGWRRTEGTDQLNVYIDRPVFRRGGQHFKTIRSIF